MQELHFSVYLQTLSVRAARALQHPETILLTPLPLQARKLRPDQEAEQLSIASAVTRVISQEDM